MKGGQSGHRQMQKGVLQRDGPGVQTDQISNQVFNGLHQVFRLGSFQKEVYEMQDIDKRVLVALDLLVRRRPDQNQFSHICKQIGLKTTIRGGRSRYFLFT